jgi:cytoskeletal protein CcmA (bactofilin family)
MENVTAVIEKGCEFVGKLTFEGTARIGGKFDGEIFTNDTLIIDEGSLIKAEIEAATVIINGEVIGNIKASGRVEIHSTGKLKGNIETPVLRIDEGVVFEGTTKMISKKIKSGKKVSFLKSEGISEV